jgi:hypothetical protein
MYCYLLHFSNKLLYRRSLGRLKYLIILPRVCSNPAFYAVPLWCRRIASVQTSEPSTAPSWKAMGVEKLVQTSSHITAALANILRWIWAAPPGVMNLGQLMGSRRRGIRGSAKWWSNVTTAQSSSVYDKVRKEQYSRLTMTRLVGNKSASCGIPNWTDCDFYGLLNLSSSSILLSQHECTPSVIAYYTQPGLVYYTLPGVCILHA